MTNKNAGFWSQGSQNRLINIPSHSNIWKNFNFLRTKNVNNQHLTTKSLEIDRNVDMREYSNIIDEYILI